MTASARRPWWRRKGTWLAAGVWLALPVVYLLAEGPAVYLAGYGERFEAVVRFLYPAAITGAIEAVPVLGATRSAWVRSWRDLPYFHDAYFGAVWD